MMKLSAQRDMNNRSIPLHDAEGFEGMRRAGRLAAETLDFIGPHVRPGISTAALDKLCETFMRDHGGVPATIGYKGYSHASCISVNHVVTHGIPSDKKVLAEGDILNIDVTPLVDGWHGDTSRTYWVGEVPTKVISPPSSEANAIDCGGGQGKAGDRAVKSRLAHGVGTLGRCVEAFEGESVNRINPDTSAIGLPGRGLELPPCGELSVKCADRPDSVHRITVAGDAA